MTPIPDVELAALLANLGAPTLQDSALAALAGLAPEPICRVCREALHLRDADLGTHVRCDPPVRPGAVPAPTLDALSVALIDFNRNAARSQQVAVGPSELGVACDRRLGYSLRNAPRQPDDRVPYAPLLGTAFHALIADALRAANERAGRERFLVEQRVSPSPDVSGSCDAYDLDTATVIDWKLTGKSTVEKAKRPAGPSQQYVQQAQVYGRGFQRLGHDVRWVRIVMLPRWSHTIADTWEWTAPYSRAVAEHALQRMREVDTSLFALDVDKTTANWSKVTATPTSEACRYCPYHRPKVPTDFYGCTGYQPKADVAVSDYLDALQEGTNR